VVIGALLVLSCTLGFALVLTHLDQRHGVVSLARPVTVGQTLSSADLRVVSVVTDVGVSVIPGSEVSTLIGRVVASSLPAGALLTPAELGPASVPAVGSAIVAELLKPGAFPPDLAAGAQVLVLPAPSAADGPVSAGASTPLAIVPAGWSATVLSVEALGDEQGSVVSLQLAVSDARAVASTSAVTVVVVPAGGA
jgi:hypothetical protein